MSKRGLLFIYLQILCFLMMLPLSAMSQSPRLPAGWSDGYVHANGIRIHYYHAIPAPRSAGVIVMVHGVTDIGLSWAPVAWELQDSYDIYMLDARGHGLSDPFTSSDDGKTLMKDVVAFVEKMGFEEPILIGHSMGAATVMQLGAEHPNLAKAIVMLDPGLGPRGPRPPQNNDEEEGAPPPPQRPSNPDRISVNMFGSPENLVAQNNYSYQDLVTACRKQSPKWGMAACQYWALSKKQYHGSYSSETWQAISGIMRTGNALAEIQVPALILKADADAEARRGHEEAVSVMQNGRLVHIDGAGHNLQHDELRRTIEIITEFLSTL